MSGSGGLLCGATGVPGSAWPVSRAGLLDAPVGGGPPVIRPRCEPSVPLVVACGAAGVPGIAWPVSWAGLLDAPVGGGPPASRPRREPSARRVVSKPGQALPPPTGAAAGSRSRPRVPRPGQRGYCASSTFACNSPVTISEFELASLELQRFWALLKVYAIELHAEFLLCVSVVTHGHRSPVQRLPRMLRIRIGCCYLDRL